MTPKNSTRDLLQLINITPKLQTCLKILSIGQNSNQHIGKRSPSQIHNFSKVARYKINSNKSVGFLYSKNKQAEKEMRETIPFTIVTNNIKYFGATLNKQVKDLYNKTSRL